MASQALSAVRPSLEACASPAVSAVKPMAARPSRCRRVEGNVPELQVQGAMSHCAPVD
jgi:hypothetical protein